MNTKKLLATLAVLASCAANAVTVNFTTVPTTATPPSGDPSYTTGGVTATGYVWSTNTSLWQNSTVIANGNGIGVAAPIGNGTVDGDKSEYLLFDFGAGTTTVSAATLRVTFLDGAPTMYFSYAWITSPPSSSTPPIPLTPFTTDPSGGPITSTPSVGTFDLTSTGSGRYLLLGANNFPNTAQESRFSVQSLTYSTVPDGASTLALMGAGIATLGLAARRRRS